MRIRIENFDEKLKGGGIWAEITRSLHTEGTNLESMSLGTQILNYAKKTPNGPTFYDVVVGT